MKLPRAIRAVLAAASLALPGTPPAARAQIQPIGSLPAQPSPAVISVPVDPLAPVSIGDVLSIGVLPAEEYSREATVNQDGKIELPLIGALMIKGLTVREIQQLVETRFARFISSPKITVTLRRFAGRRVAALGEFRAPGYYEYRDGMRMLDLLATAGGLSDFAKGSRTQILRVKDGKIETLRVNIKALLGGRSDMNVAIEAGDTVLVPKGSLTKGAQWFGINIVPYLTLVTLITSVVVLTNTK